MKKIHKKLEKKSKLYKKWHKHPLASAIHLFIFVFFCAMLTIYAVRAMNTVEEEVMVSAATSFSTTEGRLQKGGRFWFPYPYFGKPGTMSTTEFANTSKGRIPTPEVGIVGILMTGIFARQIRTEYI